MQEIMSQKHLTIEQMVDHAMIIIDKVSNNK